MLFDEIETRDGFAKTLKDFFDALGQTVSAKEAQLWAAAWGNKDQVIFRQACQEFAMERDTGYRPQPGEIRPKYDYLLRTEDARDQGPKSVAGPLSDVIKSSSGGPIPTAYAKAAKALLADNEPDKDEKLRKAYRMVEESLGRPCYARAHGVPPFNTHGDWVGDRRAARQEADQCATDAQS